MARLQDLVAENPEWKGRVEVISTSLDDTAEEARDHLRRKGWNSTRNVWAGPGGFFSGASRAFQIEAIPRSYVIDSEGMIAFDSVSEGAVESLLGAAEEAAPPAAP